MNYNYSHLKDSFLWSMYPILKQNRLRYNRSRSFIICLLLMFTCYFCNIKTTYAQNLVTNGTFNTNLAGWTATGGWTRLVNGTNGVAYNNLEITNAQLSQSVSGLNSAVIANQITLTFEIFPNDYYSGGGPAQGLSATLNVILGGTTYATFTNPASGRTLSVSSANGATVTISPSPFIFSGFVGGSSALVTVAIPWVSKPNTGTLAFSFTANGDDFAVDDVTIESCSPATITTPPAPMTICAGGNASFTVTPSGTGPFTYQWQISNDGGVSYYNECDACSTAPAVSGGLSQTVSYTGITAAYGSRLYKVTVTNACGSVTSLPAQLTVNSLPTVATPAPQTVCAATAAVFNPAVTGNGITAYQWNWNGSPLAADHAADANGTYTGSKTAVLTLTPTAASAFNGGSFTLSVTNSCGTITSQPATLTVNPLPAAPALAVAVQPTCAVTNGTFTITNFNAAYSYIIIPATGVTRTGNTVTAPAGSYTVTATASGCSSAASTPVTLNAAPGAPQQPVLAVLTQPTCTLASGSFSITNYNAAYAYTVSPATATLSGSTITGPAGTYTVTATASGCTSAASAPVVINAQPFLAAPVITAVNPTCQVLTGSVAVTAPIAGATYMLMPSGITNTTGTFAALPAASGPYTVSAALAGCNSAVSNPVSVGPPATGCVAPCEANAGTITINP